MLIRLNGVGKRFNGLEAVNYPFTIRPFLSV